MLRPHSAARWRASAIEPNPIVVVVSADTSFRESLAGALADGGRAVLSGDSEACFEKVGDFVSSWRELVEAVVIDFGTELAFGLDVLDAVRRRDPFTFVLVLCRHAQGLGSARLGANLILEGDVSAATVRNALERRSWVPDRF